MWGGLQGDHPNKIIFINPLKSKYKNYIVSNYNVNNKCINIKFLLFDIVA